MMDQKQATNLICDAVRELDLDWVTARLPEPFQMRVSDHSTGRQVYISASADGLPCIEVWKGSVWYSPVYEFNDLQIPPGIAAGQDWAETRLNGFFAAVETGLSSIRAERLAYSQAKRQQREEQNRAASAMYAALFS